MEISFTLLMLILGLFGLGVSCILNNVFEYNDFWLDVSDFIKATSMIFLIISIVAAIVKFTLWIHSILDLTITFP